MGGNQLQLLEDLRIETKNTNASLVKQAQTARASKLIFYSEERRNQKQCDHVQTHSRNTSITLEYGDFCCKF